MRIHLCSVCRSLNLHRGLCISMTEPKIVFEKNNTVEEELLGELERRKRKRWWIRTEEVVIK